jgi:dephospho-CoA kinase
MRGASFGAWQSSWIPDLRARSPCSRALVGDTREKSIPMIVLGLTGSLGMGKSTTARFFAEAGVPVHDADAAVHRLYAGAAVPAIEAAFPGTTADNGVDRDRLAARVLGDPAALARLEAIIHPLVRREEETFLQAAEASGAKVAVLDIPLLFETGAERRCDAVVVVTAPAEMQRARAFERPGMTEEKFASLLAKQMPDAEKRRRADFIVDSSQGFAAARAQVRAILQAAANLPIRRKSSP